MPADDAAGPVVGLLVNPIAGLGGRVGLKGTDGSGVVARALELGARPEAGSRAAAAVRELLHDRSGPQGSPRFVGGPGAMGAASLLEAGVLRARVEVGSETGRLPVEEGEAPGRDLATSAADTRRLALAFADVPVDLLLMSGGDGTARDVEAAIGTRIPVLGIPAGVKIQSAVFATSPAAAGRLAAAFLASPHRRTEEREVLDLDEDAYRRGAVVPQLHGYLRVPAGRSVQPRKSPAVPDDAGVAAAIAEQVVAAMLPGHRYVLGPGTTIRAIAERLGVRTTLVGIDVVELAHEGPRLVAEDVGEKELLRSIAARPATIVLTPVGGQGFLIGRGNQPLSPAVLRAAGRDALLVVATPAKLAALEGRPLLVDTGDDELDRALEGHLRVITGTCDVAIVRVAAA